MTSLSNLLEEFTDKPLSSEESIAVSDVELEELKLEAFERGYGAGWDDATTSQTRDAKQISEDLKQALQDAGFTFEDARSQVLRGLEPVLKSMVDVILPALMRETLSAQITELLMTQARNGKPVPYLLHAAPETLKILQNTLDLDGVTLVSAPDLADGQVQLRLGDIEHDVDFEETLSLMKAAVSAFYTQDPEEALHG